MLQQAIQAFQGGNFDSADLILKRVLRVDSKNLPALHILGLIKASEANYREAADLLGRAARISPNDASIQYNLAKTLADSGNDQDALGHHKKAVALAPNNPEAWLNYGKTASNLGRYEDALVLYSNALSLRSDYVEAAINKGATLKELKRFDEAIAHYDKALSLKPDYHEASWNKSLSLLLRGDFENGLPLYESRWDSNKISEIIGKNFFDEPTWLGVQSLQGKTILLYGEQGLGDFIQFSRYAKLVSDLGAKVILETPKPLANLMENLVGVSHLVIKGEGFPPFDYQCPILSLPFAFDTNIYSIPMGNPYLTSRPNEVAEWNLKLGEKRKKRVGLVWSSVSSFKDDAKRSLRLIDFVRALPLEGFEYICLQKELKECDKEFFESYKNIRFFGDELGSFSDTAALIDNLDLVISTCTSVPHLSAALGKETWVLLSHVPDWRWLLDRVDSPWYQSMKLYRQSIIGDWGDPLENIKVDLLSLIQ